MRVVVQRVSKASVKVKDRIIGKIDHGLLLLVAIGEQDSRETVAAMASKILDLRIFGDEAEKMNLSVLDVKGGLLVIPQFTLYADCSKGNRPFFGRVASPAKAKDLVEKFIQALKKSGLKVEKGEFGAKMEVVLINDGPVTINLENDG